MTLKTPMCLVKVILILIVSGAVVIGEKDRPEKLFPASDAQKKHLAESVCEDLELDLRTQDTSVEKCKESFRWDLDPARSGLQISCRTNWTVTIEVSPARLYQLVLLIPDPNDNEPYSLRYNIVYPNTKYIAINITPGTNYTTYTTVINKHGRPFKWHRKSKITKWEAPLPRKYDVQVQFPNISTSADGLFTWNHTEGLDSCFEVVTKCEKYYRKVVNIWPGSPPSALMTGLPLNESCYTRVKGLHGATTHTFLTPAVKYTPSTEKPPGDIYPEIVQDVSIVAEEDGDSWLVRITWARPGQAPDTYNVTLLLTADDVNTTAVVSGSATEAIFRGITGKGVYIVTIDAILGHAVAHTSRRAVFPNRQSRWRWWAGAAGGAWGAVGVGVVAYCWLRLRRRIILPKRVKGIDIKPIEDIFPDPVEVENWSTDVWEVKSERLLLHEVIGEGAFGVVRRGTLAPNGKEVAVKMLKEFPTLDELRSFRLEMELMKSVGAHPHVVSLVGCCSGTHPLIVAEYCSRGDLLSFLRRSWDVMASKRNVKYYNNNIDTSNYRNDLFKCQFPQEHSKLVVNKMYDVQGTCEADLTSSDLLSFCRQIAMGMEFLASNRLVHRDLAARNILVTSNRTLKIADFGLSRDVYEENQYKQQGNGKMPVKWMALESLTRRIYTTQSDVWSFGVVVWEVVTVGGSPYPEVPAARLPRLLRAGYRMPRPVNCSKQLYDIMVSCWRAIPRERPTFAELHTRLDELLNSACAREYLILELDDEPPPTPKAQRYFKMIIRAKRNWMRAESYERPLKAFDNHYTSSPEAGNGA